MGLRVDVLGVCACWVVLGHGGLGLGVRGGCLGLGKACAVRFWDWFRRALGGGVAVLEVWFWGLGWDRLGLRVVGLGVWARWVVLGHGG